MVRNGKRSSIQKYVKASIAVIQASRQAEDPVREREVLGIKSEEAQKAWHHLHYWTAKRILNSSEDVIAENGRKWYEWIKLCITDVPSFKFPDYYNVIIILNKNAIISNDEAADLFETYHKTHH